MRSVGLGVMRPRQYAIPAPRVNACALPSAWASRARLLSPAASRNGRRRAILLESCREADGTSVANRAPRRRTHEPSAGHPARHPCPARHIGAREPVVTARPPPRRPRRRDPDGGGRRALARDGDGPRRRHAARRHDRLRHPHDHGHAEQWLRGHALPRLPDLRGPHAVGPDPLGHAGRPPARARGEVGAGQGGPDQVDLLAAPRRQVPRRLRLQRGRGGLEPRALLQPAVQAVRDAGRRHLAGAQSVAQGVAEDRRLHRRDLHRVARRAISPTSSPTR